MLPEVAGNKTLYAGTKPTDLADVDYGVVRAAFAVAETGSVCLTDEGLGVNTLGYLPQHLIVLLDPADIVANIHHAYRRPEWRERRYAVFPHRPLRHGRHRGRADPRRAGRALAVGAAAGAWLRPRRHPPRPPLPRPRCRTWPWPAAWRAWPAPRTCAGCCGCATCSCRS